MITRTRLLIAAALIIIVLTLACGFGDGSCPAGTNSAYHCADNGACWVVCE